MGAAPLRLVFMLSLAGIAGHGPGQAMDFAAAQAPRAVECSVALDLMELAAPQWSRQPAAMRARLAWRRMASEIDIAKERALTERLKFERRRQAELTVKAPTSLSERALACIADAPTR